MSTFHIHVHFCCTSPPPCRVEVRVHCHILVNQFAHSRYSHERARRRLDTSTAILACGIAGEEDRMTSRRHVSRRQSSFVSPASTRSPSTVTSTTGHSPISDAADLFALAAAAVCYLDLLMAHRDRLEWQDTRRRSAHAVRSSFISLRPDTPSVRAGKHLKITEVSLFCCCCYESWR